MTRKNCLTNLKRKLVLVLAVIFTVCAIAFCLTACGDDDKEIKVTDPTYSKTETSTTISNANFYNGSANLDLTKFPITSPTGWTTATDDSASTSSVNSGIVRTSDEAWSALMKTLYDDSDFINYVKNLYEFTDEDVVKAIRDQKSSQTYNPTSAEKKDYIVDTYLLSQTNLKFANPGVHSGAEDDAIFMLNNIASETKFKLGTAQKVTSSSSVSLEKGSTYKISVWVKTANIENRGTENGASIRLKNTFNSSSQAYFKISNIIADDWTQYSIYVKADSDYTCAVTLILGLGYGSGSSSIVKDWVEGTAYFDDITCEKVDESDTASLTPSKLVYGSEDDIEATLEGNACFYDMSFDSSVETFFTNSVALPTTGELTTSNATVEGEKITSKTFNADSNGEVKIVSDTAKISVNQASYTVNITDGNFSLKSGEFAIVSFYYKNQLNKLGSTTITVDAIDKYNGKTVKHAALSTLTVVSDSWSNCIYLFKNTWEEQTREFELNVVVGPSNVRTVEYASDFATGDVYLKDIKLAKGVIDNEEEEYHNIYTFFEKYANSTINLYAGYESEFVEDENTTTYNIETAYGNFGDIVNKVTAPSAFEGVVSDHAFVNSTSSNYVINDRINDGNSDGIAGVINSEYLVNYKTGSEIGEKLNVSETTQALMINNITKNAYGFIGKNINVNKSAYASVKVSARVCDDAVAYLYLVDISKPEKQILTLDSFTVNNDVINTVPNGTKINGSDLAYAIRLTKDNMNKDGWVDVSFYLAAGNTAKSFRLEIWNGSRDASETSQGYVFVKSVDVSTSSAFTEPSSWAQAFASEGNPLYDAKPSSFVGNNSLLVYTRELTNTEKSFNNDYPDETISYSANYVWGKTATMVYGVFNTIDPVEVDPYADKTEEEDTSSCAKANADPSSFWLGFSSILLGVVLVLAIIALIIKNVRAKRKANASDAKSHYKVTSRIKKKPATKKVDEDTVEETAQPTESATEEKKEEVAEENVQPTEEQPTENATEEQPKDDYVYGEVQTFGEEKKEEVAEENVQPTEEQPAETATEEVKVETPAEGTEENKENQDK